MKTCECQAVNPDDANFCASCGKPLATIDTADAAPTPVENPEVAATDARQRQQRALRIVAISVAAIVVLAVGLTLGLRNVHIEINSNPLVSVRLSLNVCKTSVGDAGEKPVGLPSTIRMKIPSESSGTVAVYSDNEGLIEVLAPKGWNCAAAIGADGTSYVNVTPLGQSNPTSNALSAGSTAEAVSAAQTSACVGCRVALACPLFHISANDSSSGASPCPLTRPTSETTTTINAHVIEFTDPPGVHGDGAPSGGAYAAMGVMTYYGDKNSDGSWTETCLLPPSDKSLCRAIVGNFASRYGKQ